MINIFQQEYIKRDSNEQIVKRSYMKNANLSLIFLLVFSSLLPYITYLCFSKNFTLLFDYCFFSVILYLGYIYHAVKAYRLKIRDFKTNSFVLLYYMNWFDDFIPTKSSCEKSFSNAYNEKKIVPTQLLLRSEDYEG